MPEPDRKKEEQRLAEGLRRRDTAAIKEIITLYKNRLFRSAFLLCGHEADAEDLVQDTFVQAVKSGRSFLGKSALYTWIHGILINIHRNQVRKRKWLRYTQNIPDKAKTALLPGQEIDRDIARSVMAEAFEELTESHRQAIILHYFEGLTPARMAQRMGVSTGTAKSRLHYAIRALGKVVQKNEKTFELPEF